MSHQTNLPAYLQILERYANANPETVFLDINETCALTEQKGKTLEMWRHKGLELPFMKLGRKIRYRLSDVLAFRERSIFRSTRQALNRERRLPNEIAKA
jgi:hypothetical protein